MRVPAAHAPPGTGPLSLAPPYPEHSVAQAPGGGHPRHRAKRGQELVICTINPVGRGRAFTSTNGSEAGEPPGTGADGTLARPDEGK